MTREELLEKIDSGEWDDIEFKAARDDASRHAIKAVSAFANAGGGKIVFGVAEDSGALSITGVSDVDKTQNDFLTQIRNRERISAALQVEAERHKFDEGWVIVFHVPEAPRNEKPVYLSGDIRQSYIRKGAANYKCRENEIEEFLRNRENTLYDEELIDVDPEEFFDAEALHWYRDKINLMRPDADSDVDDVSFLRSKGFLRPENGRGRLLPTRAAVLIFGKPLHVFDQTPRMIVDLKAYGHAMGAYSESKRYRDREPVEDNLVNSLRTILAFFEKHTNRPFAIDPSTLQRVDDPPESESFREAAVNILIHQDYGRDTLHATIKIFEDGVEFKNPGNSFSSRENLLDPGEKEIRNPRIATAFRRIGFSEQEGAGLPDIFSNWRRLGYVPPEIENDKGERTFRLWLSRERLLGEEHIRIMDELCIPHPTPEAYVFAYLLSRDDASMVDVKALTGLHSAAALKVVGNLEERGIVTRWPGVSPSFRLADHFAGLRVDRGSATGSTPGADFGWAAVRGVEGATSSGSILGSNRDRADPTERLSKAQLAIVKHSGEAQSLVELMQATGASHRGHFKKRHLDPLVALGLLRMTEPDSPNSPAQKYVLTRAGLQIRQLAFGSDLGGRTLV